jgi:glutamyl-tRNA reductase
VLLEELPGMSKLVLIGLNHRTADVAIREKLSFPDAELPLLLRSLSSRSNIRESAILSTCNRVEVAVEAVDGDAASSEIERFLAERAAVLPQVLAPSLYRHRDEQAVRHVFRVASSLDSLVLGEPQILGQVKDAFSAAVTAGSAGSFLNSLYQTAFRVAKRVRAETNIGEHAVSVSSAAVELAMKVFEDLHRRSVLTVGAGEMGELAVRHLSSAGVRTIRVTNRNPQAARELADRFGGEAVPFEQLGDWLYRSDIVITSTGARDYLIGLPMVHQAMARRRHQPLVFIDIAVPRNVDPAAVGVDNVFCYDVDDLDAVVNANMDERRREADLAEKLIEQEVERFWTRLRSVDVGPVVQEIQSRITEICEAERERFVRRAAPMSEKDARELEIMIGRIANKVAHPFISHLRTAGQDPARQQAYADMIRRILGLEKGADS